LDGEQVASENNENVSGSSSNITYEHGDYINNTKTYTYEDKISKFTSSNKKVATINKKGKVTAKKKGTAKITVKMKSGCKAMCVVKVK